MTLLLGFSSYPFLVCHVLDWYIITKSQNSMNVNFNQFPSLPSSIIISTLLCSQNCQQLQGWSITGQMHWDGLYFAIGKFQSSRLTFIATGSQDPVCDGTNMTTETSSQPKLMQSLSWEYYKWWWQGCLWWRQSSGQYLYDTSTTYVSTSPTIPHTTA